jgi:hypothetical protein
MPNNLFNAHKQLGMLTKESEAMKDMWGDLYNSAKLGIAGFSLIIISFIPTIWHLLVMHTKGFAFSSIE